MMAAPTVGRSVGPSGSWIVAIVGGVLATLVTATAVAPAQWAGHAIQSLSGGRVELAEARGTIWNGSGTLVLASGAPGDRARVSLPDPLSWHLSPWSLVSGTVELTLSHPSALTAPVRVSAYLDGRVQLGAATLRLPAAILTGLGAPWNTVRPGGLISLQTDGVEFAQGQCRGSLTAEWEHASSALTPVSPIGHYRLQASGSYPGTRLQLQTISGPLELEGSGTIVAGPHLRFQGVARAEGSADQATKTQLTGLISLLGRRDGEAAILSFGS
jgi:general secretion pathway protein N